MGASVIVVNTIRAGIGDPARVGECGVALRAAFGVRGAAAGGVDE